MAEVTGRFLSEADVRSQHADVVAAIGRTEAELLSLAARRDTLERALAIFDADEFSSIVKGALPAARKRRLSMRQRGRATKVKGGVTQRQRILDVLEQADAPMQPLAITLTLLERFEIHADRKSISSQLKKLEKDGLVERGPGGWRLKGREVPEGEADRE